MSEFNLDNVTEYGSESTDDVGKETDGGNEKKNIAIDYSLYCKFWSLQDFFRNPNQCYDKIQWKVFCSVSFRNNHVKNIWRFRSQHATSILSTFQGLKLDYVIKDYNWSDANTFGDNDTPYFSKYLTNQKLLDLQIYDGNFRRFILLQFLILFQYLMSNVKFKS